VGFQSETKVGSIVGKSFGIHPYSDAGFAKRLGTAMLEHAGTDAVLDVMTIASFKHHRLNTLRLKQSRQQETGRPGTNNANLGTHVSRLQ
jgi:hypothetical protein